MDSLSLLAGHQHSRAEWEKAAADVLRRAGRMSPEDPDAQIWQKLTRTTLDGIEIPPLGVADALADVAAPGLPGAAPYTRGSALSRPDQGWDVRAHLADPDPERAASDAVLDLENGVTSLWLTVGRGGVAVQNLPQVLEKVYVDLAPVVLDAPEETVAAAEAYLQVVRDRDVPPASGSSLGVDPVGPLLRGAGAAERVAPDSGGSVAAVVTRLAELARGQRIFALTVDGTAAHDVGATDAQELGYALAVGVACLRILSDAGWPVAEAAALLEFRYAATDEQLATIAKLRAARRLWHRVLELSGAQDAPGQVQHAVTSRPMTTRYDPWVNMLRGTVAAFAAGVGGASSVTVLPFDSAFGLPDALGRRNARNASSVLIHEAHLARVTDPAGGSYAVERLTDDLARAGWAQLQRIEAEGGVLASVLARDTGIAARIREEGVAPRERQIATRRRAITGVSAFPNLGETLPERRRPPEGAPRADAYARPFEELRDEPAATPVFLATLGSVAQHTARAGFAANLLAAGGVDTVAAGATAGVEDVVAAYRATQPSSRVVCLAGTDAAYADRGPAVVAALREAGAHYVILVGKPGDTTVPTDLVDDACARGVDALAFLHRVRAELAR